MPRNDAIAAIRGRLTSRRRIAAIPQQRTSDLHRAAILALLLGTCFLGGFGIQTQIESASHRSARYLWHKAAMAQSELRDGAILFVSDDGNRCRRRWIDNSTWMLRDGGDVECEQAAGWHSRKAEIQALTGSRMDAVRNTFRGKPYETLE